MAAALAMLFGGETRSSLVDLLERVKRVRGGGKPMAAPSEGDGRASLQEPPTFFARFGSLPQLLEKLLVFR